MENGNAIQPSFQILICLIQIWNIDNLDNATLLVPPKNAMMITECESIEIEESYKKLIGTASVKFPRGTVIRRTVTEENESEIAYDQSVSASFDSAGVVEEVRKQVSDVAKVDTFKIGQRIRIYLGYTEDPAIADMAKVCNVDSQSSIFVKQSNLEKYKSAKGLNLMFDGYITKISIDTPIQLYCENLASYLKQVTCKKMTIKSNSTINDFLSEKGPHHMLRGTGLKLHPDTESQVFDLGRVDIPEGLTVADVVTHWSQFGMHAFVTEYDGSPVLAIGRSYFSNAKKDSIINASAQSSVPVEILFDYNVAENGLTLTSADKKFLAVEAQGLDASGKFYHMTILKNPTYKSGDESSGSPYRILNETQISKKAMKLGVRTVSGSSESMNMDMYTIIPYHSRKIPVNHDELMEESIKYLESYNMNGIEGTLTLFGDLHLHTATKVHLRDDRYPSKNGYYLVDEVHTTFGSSGYRQTIGLPYCIQRDKPKNDKQNEQE